MRRSSFLLTIITVSAVVLSVSPDLAAAAQPVAPSVLLNRALTYPAGPSGFISVQSAPFAADQLNGAHLNKTGFLYFWTTASISPHSFSQSGPRCQPERLSPVANVQNPKAQSIRSISWNRDRLVTVQCEPRGNPAGTRVAATPDGRSIQKICTIDNRGATPTHACLNFSMQPVLTSDGNLAASSAGVPDSQHGAASKIIASDSPTSGTEAIVTFARASGTHARQLKTLILRRRSSGGRIIETAQKIWYR